MTDNRSGQQQWAVMTDRLGELAQESLSSRQIAIKLSEEFSFNVTRGAVMGKLHRSGFRPSGVNGPGPPRGSQRSVVKVKKQVRQIAQMPQMPQGVHIMDLKHNQCRWIEGPAASMLYCGQPTEIGLSWCPEHEKVVYGKSNVRRE